MESIALSDQLASALFASVVLQYLKNKSWFPFLEDFHAKYWKMAVSAFTALLTTLGMMYTFDYTFAEGGRLVVDIPNVSELLNNILAFIKQWIFQHGMYEGLIKEKKP